MKKYMRREQRMIDGQTILVWILLGFLITCAIAAIVSKNLLTTVLIFMSYSLVMSIIWVVIESPDLAGTEAAVGAGVTTILFFITLKKVGELHTGKKKKKKDQEEGNEHEGS